MNGLALLLLPNGLTFAALLFVVASGFTLNAVTPGRRSAS